MTKKQTKSASVKTDGYNDIFKSEATERASLAYQEPTNFYVKDPLARKIIDVIPEEMVTPGFGLDGLKDEKAFKSMWDALKLDDQIIEALCWSRLYGGSAIVAMLKDGRALTSPVRDDTSVMLESIRVYEKEQIKVKTKETNPRNARYGLPKVYTINPGGNMTEYDVHYTRVYVFNGNRIPETLRRQNNGWGVSVLSQGLIDAIVDYNYCEELATQLLRRKQQAVWKAKGLAELCDDDEGRWAARLRLAQVDDNSGVGRSVGIDANDEEFEVLNSDISGIDAFLDKKMDRIVNYSGIHEIILKNKNVGGVSSSQNVALETFYKLIERQRKNVYRPLLEWLIPYLVHEEEWSIRFEPLSVPSEKEQAETFKNHVEGVSKLITDQVIDVEEGRDTLEAVCDILKLKAGLPKLPKRDPASTGSQPVKTPTTPQGKSNEGETDS